MADNIITNANDVEVVLESGSSKAGTNRQMGRMVVDDFSIGRTEDNSSVSGVGFRLPAGITYGDIEFEWSFTMMGSDTNVFNMIATQDGRSKEFSFTARKIDDNGDLVFEFALDTCVTTDEEYSGSSGDPTEYPVSGIAVSIDRRFEQ